MPPMLLRYALRPSLAATMVLCATLAACGGGDGSSKESALNDNAGSVAGALTAGRAPLDVVPRTTTVDVLPGTTTVDVLPGTTTVDVLPGTTTVDVLPGTTTVDVLPGTTTVDVLPGTTTVDVLPGTTTVDVLPGTTTVDVLPGTTTVDVLPGTTTVDVLPGTTTVVTGAWSSWTKNAEPVFAGPYGLVGDPSVIRDGDVLRMVYNCFDPMRQQGAVCQALTTDGISWVDAPLNDGIAGRVIRSRAGEWDDTHETPLIFKHGDESLLYFSGYVNKGGFVNSFPAFLGLATSSDGLNFTRYGSEPVIKPTPGGYDNDAVFSPSIVEYEGQLVMIYTGHCWTNCRNGTGVFLLAATSNDGRHWIKRPDPVMSRSDLPFTKNGAAEADLVKGPDNYYYLFVTLLYDDVHDIGIARSANPYGPWEINPSPVVSGTVNGFDARGTVAPSVLIEGGKARMWFHGFGADGTIRIGYAEAPWPLRLR